MAIFDDTFIICMPVWHADRQANGAEIIFCGDAKNEGRALGADHYHFRDREDWMEEVYRIASDRGADHILEVTGRSHFVIGSARGRGLAWVASRGVV